MKDLIGGPLSAACDAQVMLAQATYNYIQEVGFEQSKDDKGDKTFQAVRMVDFSWTQPEQVVNGDKVTIEKATYDLSVPLLAIVPIPTLQVTNVDITFDMAVKSSTSSSSASNAQASLKGQAKVGWGPFSVSVTVQGSVSSSSKSQRSSDNSAKYHVEVQAQQLGTPEGLSRVFDLLNECIRPVKSDSKSA